MSLFSILFWSHFSLIRFLGFEYFICHFREPSLIYLAILLTAYLCLLFLLILPSYFPNAFFFFLFSFFFFFFFFADLLSLMVRVFVFLFVLLNKKKKSQIITVIISTALAAAHTFSYVVISLFFKWSMFGAVVYLLLG